MEEWKEYKFIRRIGSDKTGHWEVIRKEEGMMEE